MMSTTDAPSLASTDGSAASSSFASNNQPSSTTGGVGGMANANSSGPATAQHNASAPQNAGATVIQTAQTATSYSSSLDSQIERLKRCEYLRENEVKALCLRAREILVDEGNVQRVDAPVTVSGCMMYCVVIVLLRGLICVDVY